VIADLADARAALTGDAGTAIVPASD
jgi:hypothetical protein